MEMITNNDYSDIEFPDVKTYETEEEDRDLTPREAKDKIEDLFRKVVIENASDLHLSIGSPPLLRVHGHLMPVSYSVIKPKFLEQLVFSILTEEQKERFYRDKGLDFAYTVAGVGRFRGNILIQRGTVGAVFRFIPSRPYSFEELGLPPVVAEVSRRPRGLLLVTGPTGCGKTTTQAAIINYINENKTLHIITIEDPIEYVHWNKKSLVRQREIGIDTLSFSDGLRHALRQDPDVILIGEMRDLETISIAITAAETGHLVLATLHTVGAAATVDRIIDVFPPHQQQQIRLQLSMVLQGVITQHLIPNIDGQARSLALEIMVMTPAIRNLIREGKSHQISTMIQTGGQFGMVTLESSLKLLYQKGKISYESAYESASSIEEFKRLLGEPSLGPGPAKRNY